MDKRKYLFSSCVLFALIFLIQILILVSDWEVSLENFVVPRMIFVIAAVISVFFSYKSFVYWHSAK